MPAQIPSVQSRFFTAPDGLRLHVRDYGPAETSLAPIVCLPGLSRNALDFEPLAWQLAQNGTGPARRVLALDYRGRGLSEHDADWRNYNMSVEGGDILAVLTACGIEQAVFIGTSRGGMHVMALSAMRPALIKAAVLNDIGPVLEAKGLARIRSYIGKLPAPASWPDAVDLLKRIGSTHFTALTAQDWGHYARCSFEEKDGLFRARYDSRLLNTLAHLDLEAPLPQLWPQFEGLRHVPLLILRGSNSDLLSTATLEQMQQRHPACAVFTVEGQGHAPLLADAPSIGRIADFIASTDAA